MKPVPPWWWNRLRCISERSVRGDVLPRWGFSDIFVAELGELLQLLGRCPGVGEFPEKLPDSRVGRKVLDGLSVRHAVLHEGYCWIWGSAVGFFSWGCWSGGAARLMFRSIILSLERGVVGLDGVKSSSMCTFCEWGGGAICWSVVLLLNPSCEDWVGSTDVLRT